jgi:hypothetical protein
VVETAIQEGLGSAVLLRALERNAEEGSSGELISFDVMLGVEEDEAQCLGRPLTHPHPGAVQGTALCEPPGNR